MNEEKLLQEKVMQRGSVDSEEDEAVFACSSCTAPWSVSHCQGKVSLSVERPHSLGPKKEDSQRVGGNQ